MQSGVTMTTTLLAKDTAHKTVYPVFTAGGGFDMEEMQGGGDFVMVADPDDLSGFALGAEHRLALVRYLFHQRQARAVLDAPGLRDALARLAAEGYDFLAGLEVEFHLFKLENPRLDPVDATWPPQAPEVSLLNQGYQYLTEIALRSDRRRARADPARRRRRSACRSARSKSSSGRASANSPSVRSPPWRPPTR